MNELNTIYLVYVNADMTEGRGPMILAKNSGFFINEDEAWQYADTLCGIMGRKPSSGSWRTERYRDIEVRKFYRHNEKKINRILELEKEITQKVCELEQLTK